MFILRFKPDGTSMCDFETLAGAVAAMAACVSGRDPDPAFKGYAEVSNETGELVFASVNLLGELRPKGLGPLEVTYAPEWYSEPSKAWRPMPVATSPSLEHAKRMTGGLYSAYPVRVREVRAHSRVIWERASNPEKV